tara:strand:+ start:91 stop:333 length:243 start_codon:yes stop_codon:yes gene_type:complete
MWILYIIKCNDNSFYTGITTNFKRRLFEHSRDKGAKYTRGRGPFELVYKEKYETRSEASKREYEIKQLSNLKKLQLINKK